MKHIRFVWEDAFHRLVKRTAAERGVTITALVQDAVQRECERPQPKVTNVSNVRDVLPESPARHTAVWMDEAEPVPESAWRGPIPKPTKSKR